MGRARLLLLLAIAKALLPSLESLLLLLLLMLLLLEATELLLWLSHAPAKLVVKPLIHLSISLPTTTPKTTALMTAICQE